MVDFLRWLMPSEQILHRKDPLNAPAESRDIRESPVKFILQG